MLRWNAQFLSLLVCIVPPLVFPATPASALPNPPVLVQQSTVAMHYGLDVQRAKAAGQKIREDNGVTVVSDASGKEVMRFFRQQAQTINYSKRGFDRRLWPVERLGLRWIGVELPRSDRIHAVPKHVLVGRLEG